MPRSPGGLASLYSLALVLSSCPSVLHAQVSLDVGPTVGFYASLTNTEGPGTAVIGPAPSATWKQEAAAAYGGEATVWLGRRIGIGASYLYSASGVAINGNAFVGAQSQESASVQVATARATFAFDVGQNPVYLSGGVSRIMRGGTAWEDFDNPSNTAGLVGVGTGLKIARHLRVNIGMDAFFYSLSLKPTNSTLSFPAHSQVDIVGRVGLVYRLGG